MFVIKQNRLRKRYNVLALVIFLLLPILSYADELTNPYMTPVKINIQDCINENMNDCLKSICMASPASCHAQCMTNSSDKCKKMAGQNVYED